MRSYFFKEKNTIKMLMENNNTKIIGLVKELKMHKYDVLLVSKDQINPNSSPIKAINQKWLQYPTFHGNSPIKKSKFSLPIISKLFWYKFGINCCMNLV